MSSKAQNIDMTVFSRYIAEGLVTERKHPEHDLYIYNYTPRCQYGRHWDPVTLNARGLIVTGSGELVARPFPKFFNLEEYPVEGLPLLPNLPFSVYEKLDGSLGILYRTPAGEWSIATRGAFDSPQALAGTELLRRFIAYNDVQFVPHYTYLFEIIHPATRVVVDYGDKQQLVLLAVRNTVTGEEVDLDTVEYPHKVKQYDGVADYHQIRELINENNKEGFVVLFADGTRVKMKYAEYTRLHRVIAGLSPRRIWECLRDGKDLLTELQGVPDETFARIRATQEELLRAFVSVKETCEREFRGDFATRKEAATYFKTCTYPAALFQMLDGREPDDTIWKIVKPKSDG